MQPIYLVKVDPQSNNNKYYKMTPNGDSFVVEYGRVGNAPQPDSYPISKWDAQLRSKLKKGYVDQTDLVADVIPDSNKKSHKNILNDSIAYIVQRLQDFAKRAIETNYTISSNKVTEKMIVSAQDILNRMSSVSTVSEFNEYLVALFYVIPRKMKRVSDNLAETSRDFSRIVQDEQALLDTMKAQVVQQIVTDETDSDETVLEAMGLEFYDVSADEEREIKKHLGSSSHKFKKAWKVINNKTQRRFDNFIKANKVSEKKLLFHGSRNENWWSIINTGLMLRPNAIITGKMYGMGCYYSPDADKAFGYTSLYGSRWANGNQQSGFVGVFDVAYGKPYHVYSFDSKFHNFNYELLQKASSGAHSLHAHGGTGMLRKDEIVVYKEEQSTIKYIVEIG